MLSGGWVRMWGKAVAVAVGFLALSGCSVLPGGEQPSDADTTPRSHKVVLEVIGDGVKRADVTYVTESDRKEDHRAKLPWSETVTAVKLDGISVVAQNTGDAGTLTCTVAVDGKVRKKVTVEGEFALVACDLANVPPATTSTPQSAGTIREFGYSVATRGSESVRRDGSGNSSQVSRRL